MITRAYVDAKGLLVEWLGSRSDLVGPGKPLAMGVHHKPLRSPAKGAYGWVIRIGGANDWVAEGSILRARLSTTVYALAERAASDAADALANELLSIPQLRPHVRDCQLLAVDAMSGPVYTGTGSDVETYMVDTDLFVTPYTPIGQLDRPTP